MDKNLESCDINDGKITPNFKVESGSRQGGLIPAYILILVLEVIFKS